jgi:hypothetical protein
MPFSTVDAAWTEIPFLEKISVKNSAQVGFVV